MLCGWSAKELPFISYLLFLINTKQYLKLFPLPYSIPIFVPSSPLICLFSWYTVIVGDDVHKEYMGDMMMVVVHTEYMGDMM